MIQKQRSTTVITKTAVLPLELKTAHYDTTTIYHHAWVACYFVTPEPSRDWMLHQPMRSLLPVFRVIRGTCWIKSQEEAKATEAITLQNFHYDTD